MRSQENMIILMAATIMVAVYAFTQTTPNDPVAIQEQYTGAGPSTVGPASGPHKVFSDPKVGDAGAKAWHKQHTRGGPNWASAEQRTTRIYLYPDPVTIIGPATKQN